MRYQHSQEWLAARFIAASVGMVGIAHAREKEILDEDRAARADGVLFHKYVGSDGIIHAVGYDKDDNEIAGNDRMERPSEVMESDWSRYSEIPLRMMRLPSGSRCATQKKTIRRLSQRTETSMSKKG